MELGNVFHVYNGFECKRFVIEARSATITPEQSFQRICVKLGYAGEEGDLTIFYYAGRTIWDPRLDVSRFQYVPPPSPAFLNSLMFVFNLYFVLFRHKY